ncbi:hypothetical protein PINS_up018518 [Pythium insidiosum]|nr:hypothetical protein PINS_up018518 [Pythium insidiosum]
MKLKIVEQAMLACRESRKIAHEELAEWAQHAFKLAKQPSRTAISKLLKNPPNPQAILEDELDFRRTRDEDILLLDRELSAFIRAAEECKIFLNAITVKMLAFIFTVIIKTQLDKVPLFSEGWVHAFQVRTGLFSYKKHGEAGSVDFEAAERGRKAAKEATTRYAKRDVFNMDETA